MGTIVWRAGLILLLVLFRTASSDGASDAPATCPKATDAESILGPPEGTCPALDDPSPGGHPISVVEGDEVALYRALNLVHKNMDGYVAVLFYSSSCPFSKLCRPKFNVLSSLFPGIPHFAFEESGIRPSILLRYGIQGFPTLFLMNHTMPVRYRGSRTIDSLVAFYNNVTGVSPASPVPVYDEKIVDPSDDSKLEEDIEHENFPLWWASSPEKLFQQDAYLALAIIFLLIRLLCFLLPKLIGCVKRAWKRHMSLWDHSHSFIERAKQGFDRLDPSKRSNLQGGGAMNAKAWASKSLASVSIGEPSSGRGAQSASERR